MTVPAIIKHRLAQFTVSINFADELAVTDSLAGTPTIYVTTAGATKTDVTTEFVTESPQIDGTSVEFRLDPATSGQQEQGRYEIAVVCETTLGMTVADARYLLVSALGDPGAP